MTTLWDTTAREAVGTLVDLRRSAGAVATGLVLTLVVIADERSVHAAIDAATRGAAAHPCRLLVVVRRQPDAAEPRLDAEITVGGQLGPGESIVLRMYGRLAGHAESVVLPLLAPDTPVVTWWFGAPPQRIGQDPLGALASRRITDSAAADDPLESLRRRARDYTLGDTDLAWTRLTPWRALLASAFDTVRSAPREVVVAGETSNPSVDLLAAWLRARLGVPGHTQRSTGPGITEVRIDLADGFIALNRPDGRAAQLDRAGAPTRTVPLHRRDLGDLLGEELRRLDADEPYAEALGAFAHPQESAPTRVVSVPGAGARGGEPVSMDVSVRPKKAHGDSSVDVRSAP